MTVQSLGGSMVALVTPMHADGSIDWPTLDGLVDWHVSQNTEAIVAVGTTGESATLDVDEHSQAIERIVDVVDKRIPVIAGTGANSTREAIYLTEHAQKVGADASLLVTPYYNKPTQEGMYQHYKAIAEAVDMPHVLYNVPGRTGVDLLPETVNRLADIENIVGIKEAKGSIARAQELVDTVSDRMAIYSGEDGMAMELMLAGGHGNISVVANVVPTLMHRLCQAAVAGDRSRAEHLNQHISALHSALFMESNPIPVKWAMQDMGWLDRGIRLPLTKLASQYHEEVRQALKQAFQPVD